MYQVVSIYECAGMDVVDVLGTYDSSVDAERAANEQRVRLEPIGCDVEVR